MTDEEKAEEILQTKGSMTFCAKGCGYTEKVKELIAIGLSEGRKESILKECATDCKIPEGCDVFVRYELLAKENAELLESCRDKDRQLNNWFLSYNEVIKENEELNRDKTELVNSVTELTNSKTELENKVTELKADKEYLDKVNNEQTEVILKLNEQIEKMKCCGNCKHWIVKLGFDSKCELNEPCEFGKRDKWELAE